MVALGAYLATQVVVLDHTSALVLDSSVGQAARAQAESFHQAVPIGSIVLTKMDGHAKGGGALASAPVDIPMSGNRLEMHPVVMVDNPVWESAAT